MGRDVLGVEGHDGQEFDMGNAERLEIGDLLDEAGEGPGVKHPGGGVAGEAPEMQLVDHGILEGDVERGIPLPIVGVRHHQRAHGGRDIVPEDGAHAG